MRDIDCPECTPECHDAGCLTPQHYHCREHPTNPPKGNPTMTLTPEKGSSPHDPYRQERVTPR